MKSTSLQSFFKNNKGFSLMELLVYLSIMSFLLVSIVSFVMWMNSYSLQANASSETLENARTALDVISYEIRGAKGVYMPTTSDSQLSLETTHYLPDNENISFIDFFLCGTAVCLKKESQESIALTPDSVEVTNLSFTQINNSSLPSIRTSLTVRYNNSGEDYSFTLTSTAIPRSY